MGFAGDGGPATAAQLNAPVGVALDPAGNLYIAERENHRIRKVTPGGVISTYAGTGTQGFSGDGGPATGAQLLGPGGVALDPAGNFYIADRNNDRIRRVSTDGTIATYAGSGSLGFSGDGGPATAARLNMSLGGVALDSAGNLYIADLLNERIRKVSPVGTISTYAGNGGYGFWGDGGPGTAAQLRPRGMALDPAGNLYIADFGNSRVRKVTPGGTISTYAGTGTPGFAGDGGPATAAQLSFPQGVALDSAGNLYIADSNNNRIRKVTPGGTISTYAGTGLQGFSGDGGPAIDAQLWFPVGVALDSAGNLYIADQENQRIRKVTP